MGQRLSAPAKSTRKEATLCRHVRCRDVTATADFCPWRCATRRVAKKRVAQESMGLGVAQKRERRQEITISPTRRWRRTRCGWNDQLILRPLARTHTHRLARRPNPSADTANFFHLHTSSVTRPAQTNSIKADLQITPSPPTTQAKLLPITTVAAVQVRWSGNLLPQ